MPYRHGDEGTFLARNRQCQSDGDSREGDATMRQNAPLRSSGRTGSVEDFRDRIVVGFSADQLPGLAHFRVEAVDTRLAAGRKGSRPGVDVRDDIGERCIKYEDLGTGMPEDVFELRRLELMVHGDYYRTQSPRPKERVHEFRSIEAHEGHGIAGTYTSFRQDGRREVGPCLHFSVGDGDASRADERLVGMFPDCTIEGCDEIHEE